MKRNKLFLSLSLLGVLFLLSCNDYLELKPNKKLSTPETIADLQAILDNYLVMNQSLPYNGEEGSDNYYVLSNIWQGISSATTRGSYIWEDDGGVPANWTAPYKTIFCANVVLDALEKIKEKNTEVGQSGLLRGSALFYRANCYYELAQVFCLAYDAQSATHLGLPLRLDADYKDVSKRTNLEATYQQIIKDINDALPLVPKTVSIKSRPNKAAVFGLLAKVRLVMGNYEAAENAADSCLKYQNVLMDYNDLSLTATTPIARYNPEVIFTARSVSESALTATSRCRIDTLLYASYAANDLRKSIYFKVNKDLSYTVKASYDGTYVGAFFMGIATDEIYLIRAECRVRNQNLAGAMEDLNTLMAKRIQKSSFVKRIANDWQEALDLILIERRKELVFRGSRWTDIKRLNKENRYAITLKRLLEGKLYELKPGDKRFAYLIPTLVINRSGMEQNER
ncbi:RagB/SusD family nutrient uptake outer membrane protein [Pedobacter arcticus]|uniref:RagB/SusD family nutrient uptake outer membrane protein n=1 Tax=Pedobacter arcticus TaxID=752140 RepID=UPI000312027A|nr:RagB/SusD family nutrient uptake outer membrane protein [Pedobacter arcticus]